MNRRTFLRSSAILAAFAPASRTMAASRSAADGAKSPRRLKKGLMFLALNSPTARQLPLRERFQLVRDAGFAGVEVGRLDDGGAIAAAGTV